MPRDRDRPSGWERFLTVERSGFHRYAAAVVFALLSLTPVYFLERLEGVPLSSLALMSVIASAIYGGRGPALLATAITALAIDYVFVEPLFAMSGAWTSVARALIFASVGFVVANLVTSLRAAYLAVHARHREAELARIARENVLAVVSHDLRSPLSTILMNTAFLKRLCEAGKPTVDARKQLDSIHRAAERMNRLIEDLLDAVKIDAGQLRVQLEENDLVPVIEDAIESAQTAAGVKGVRIVIAAHDGKQRAYCDRGRITQVLCNVIGNAIKFSPDDGEVTVAIRSAGDWVTIEVKDSGVGIPQEHLPDLFARRWQAQETAHQGTGLGLFIAKSIVDAHGGRIEVQSKVGRGTTVRICLPSVPAAPAARSGISSAAQR